MAVPRTWVSALAVGTLTAAAGAAAAAPASAHPSPVAHFKPHAIIEYHPAAHLNLNYAATRTGTTLAGGLPVFTSKQTDPTTGKTYHYTMVGKNPKVAQTAPTTTIKTKLIPVKILLPDGTAHNPAIKNHCDTVSPLTRTVDSPIFVKQDWTFGATDTGTSQYVDAFRRAEFWHYTQPGGLNPGYHVSLKMTQLPTVTVRVPGIDAATAQTSCAKEIAVKIQWLDSYLRKTLLPDLAKQKLIGPSTFPLLLLNNTVEYDTNINNCCILGYHNVYTTSRGNIQTFGVADYENSGFFNGANLSDVEILSHEIAEWMDDPLGTNPTPAWTGGQVTSGCQSNLEVGDPLTGTTISDAVNTPAGPFTYNLQELAFVSWFYRTSPSYGVNGWYSNNGTFTTPSATCP